MGDEWPEQRGGFGGGRSGGSWRGNQGNGYDEGSGGQFIEISSGHVGRLIGKGGSKIRELQERSGARINVPRDRGSSAVVQVELSGSDDCIMQAKELINELTSSTDSYRDRGQQSYGRGAGGGDGECHATVEVASSFVGRIIGRGGSKIRELQDQSGARINVPRDRGSVVNIEITGSEDRVNVAKQMINDLLSEESRGGGDWGGQRGAGGY